MTYSILAVDPDTGLIGAAVASCNFGIGPRVVAARAGVGVAAGQSGCEPSHRELLLDLVGRGLSATDAVAAFSRLPGVADCQIGLVDGRGGAAAWTGPDCLAEASQAVGDGVACQANLMASPKAAAAMLAGYRSAERQPLAERLLAALRAGLAAGGDVRGEQAAAMYVVPADPGIARGADALDPTIDLRVDDSPTPLTELARLLGAHRAQAFLMRGLAARERGSWPSMADLMADGLAAAPEDPGLRMWAAVALSFAGRHAEAAPHLRWVRRHHPHPVEHLSLIGGRIPELRGDPRLLVLLDILARDEDRVVRPGRRRRNLGSVEA